MKRMKYLVIKDQNSGVNEENEIEMNEIVRALRIMKIGKAEGYDGVSVKMLKSGDGVVASLLCLVLICVGGTAVYRKTGARLLLFHYTREKDHSSSVKTIAALVS